MSQETKGNIRRVPKGCEGIPEDGVEMMAKCTITNFTVKKRKVTGIGQPDACQLQDDGEL